jgi:predicted MFS family arabinose efflux permease
MPASAQRPTFRALAGNAEFRALFAGFLVHAAARTVATLALSVTVFQRSDSALLSAIALASSFLPHAVGVGFLLSLADRVRPRGGLAVVSLVQMLTIAIVASGGLPVGVILAIVLVGGIANPVGTAIRAAAVADALDDQELHVLGRAAINMTSFVGQGLGFAAGGVIVATTGPAAALWLAAAVSLIAAATSWFGLADRPLRTASTGSAVRQTWKTNRLLVRTKEVRGLLLVHWLPLTLAGGAQALFIPYAAQLGSASLAAVFFWASTAGTLTGYLLIGRLADPARQAGLSLPLAVLQALPLLGFAAQPPVAPAIGLCFLSTLGGAYHVGLQRRFVAAVPQTAQAQAFGLVYSGIPAIQGVTITVAGALAGAIEPGGVIVLFGLASGIASLALIPFLRPARRDRAPSSSSAASAAVSTPDGP